MSNYAIVDNVVQLCEENLALKKELEDLKAYIAKVGKITLEEDVVERGQTPLEKMLIKEGKERLVSLHFDSYYFRTYGPKVYVEDQGDTEDNIKTFEQYLSELSAQAFESDFISDMFTAGITFPQFKECFKDELYERYEKAVRQRLEEVALINEDVRATEA